MDKLLSTKQVVLTTFVMNLAIKFIVSPILLLKSGGRNAIVCVAVFLAFDILQMLFLIFSSHFAPDKTFNQMTEEVLGKTVSKILTLVVFFYALIKVIFFMMFFKVFVSRSLFEGVVWAIYCVPLIIVLMTFGMRSLRSIGRLSEIFFIIIIAALLLIMILSSGNMKILKLLPIGSEGGDNMLFTLLRYPMWFGDYFIFILFLGKIKRAKKFNLIMILSLVITSVLIFVSFAAIFSSYIDSVHFYDFSEKLSSLTQMSISSSNTGRFDIILFSAVFLGAVIMMGAYFYFTVRSAESLLAINKPSRWVSLAAAILIFIAVAFIFPSEGILIYIFTKILNITVWVIQIAMPVLIFIVALIWRKKYEKQKNINMGI